MLLFTRTVTFESNPRDAIPWALDMTAFVNEHTDLDVSLWTTLFGAPVGTMSWSCFVESRAMLAAAMGPLNMDPDYLAKIDPVIGTTLAPPTDDLRQIVHHGGDEYRRAGVGAVVQLITAEVAGGQLARAMAWGIEIADVASNITETPVLFCKDAYGQFGQVTWISSFDDISHVDRAQEALNKDGDYLAKVDEAGELFIPGSGRQGLAQRIA